MTHFDKIFAFLSVLYVILLIFFVNSLLKQQSTQLPAMKAVISHENFQLCMIKQFYFILVLRVTFWQTVNYSYIHRL
jgi:hypothetical protein